MDNKLSEMLNQLLADTNIANVTADSNAFQELPEGYYLSKLSKAELKESKTSGLPMVALDFIVLENGVHYVATDDGDISLQEVKNSKNKHIFMYYVLKDSASLKRFVSDMLKFEAEPGKPVLEKEYFMNQDVLEQALQILVDMQLYVQITKSENKDGQTQTWQNPISWKRAASLELPM